MSDDFTFKEGDHFDLIVIEHIDYFYVPRVPEYHMFNNIEIFSVSKNVIKIKKEYNTRIGYKEEYECVSISDIICMVKDGKVVYVRPEQQNIVIGKPDENAQGNAS